MEDNQLISPAAANTYKKYMERLTTVSAIVEEAKASAAASKQTASSAAVPTEETKPHERSNDDLENLPKDTVGACAIDIEGNVASGVSSGGIWLKHPGRIGQASSYGCGCWAERHKDTGVATSTTGRGEQLIKTLLARELAQAALSSNNLTLAVSRTFNEKFLDSKFLTKDDVKQGGALILHAKDGFGELTWAHTTASMCVGYFHVVGDDSKPVAVVSRLPEKASDGCALHMQGVSLKLIS